MVGIDRGVTRFATLSDGTFHEPLNAFRKMETETRQGTAQAGAEDNEIE